MQTFMERFAAAYTPAVLGAADPRGRAPSPAGARGSALDWAYRALVVLVIACPCAIVLAAPVVTLSALTRATREGILFKGARHLEALGKIRAVAFDKTGTLTHGRLRVTRVRPAHGWTEEEVLRLAGAVEAGSAHPVAEAIRREAARRGVATAARGTLARTFAVVEGQGVRAEVDGQKVYVGNPGIFERKESLRTGSTGSWTEAAPARVGGARRHGRRHGGGDGARGPAPRPCAGNGPGAAGARDPAPGPAHGRQRGDGAGRRGLRRDRRGGARAAAGRQARADPGARGFPRRGGDGGRRGERRARAGPGHRRRGDGRGGIARRDGDRGRGAAHRGPAQDPVRRRAGPPDGGGWSARTSSPPSRSRWDSSPWRWPGTPRCGWRCSRTWGPRSSSSSTGCGSCRARADDHRKE